jgi:hypothetical protein
MAVEKTRRHLHPLCYEHHVPMKPVQFEKRASSFITYSLAYACPHFGCFICYAGATGYFTIEDGNQSERAEVPQVSCPKDGHPMYLADLHPQKTSLRLWRCGNANCPGHATIEEFVVEPNDPLLEQYFRANR